MHSVTKGMLERSLEVLRAQQPWADYGIDWAYGQPRLGCSNGSRDLSGRGTKREVNNYIWAMITALRMEATKKQDDAIAAELALGSAATRGELRRIEAMEEASVRS